MLEQNPLELINLEEYPLHAMDSEIMQNKIRDWHQTFMDTGILVLRNFILPDKLSTLVTECNNLLDKKFHHHVVGNAYLTRLEDIEEAVEDDHPLRMTESTDQSAVAYDDIPESFGIRQIYEWPETDEFIRRLVGAENLYHYACPMGAINIGVMEKEDYLRWHFDQSEFVVSIHVQEPESGGVYEYVHDIRSATEPNYDSVRAVLKGDRSKVEFLDTAPGNLILFTGRNTIHRVTPVKGDRPRISLLYSYAEEPGVTSSPFLRAMRYGRTEARNPSRLI